MSVKKSELFNECLSFGNSKMVPYGPHGVEENTFNGIITNVYISTQT